jgi:hypothetical protein
MQHQGPLPCLQKPATAPYPEVNPAHIFTQY